MEYNPETAFKILKAMENYKESAVPSPLTALDEDTGLPPPPPKPHLIDPSTFNFDGIPNLPTGPITQPSRPQAPETTAPRSWVGEMDYAIFMAHVGWMKQERLITTGDSNGYPREIAIAGVRLLKEVEAKGGWDKAMEIATEAKAATTLTGILEALRKAKP